MSNNIAIEFNHVSKQYRRLKVYKVRSLSLRCL